jgi:hypothetical protein
MNLHVLKNNRILMAYTVAIAADAIQIPLCLMAFTGFLLPVSEVVVIAVDVAAAGLIIAALGFSWVLMPTIVVESVIGLDAIPTWTLAVAYIVGHKKTSPENASLKTAPSIDIDAIHLSSEIGSRTSPPVIQRPPPGSTSSVAVGQRLADLDKLHHSGLITAEEFQAKRQQVLAQL